ncbi:AmmeMemoRadiSam system radical SAM enzyme [Corynebacterium sp. H78]|uniref:AmmeMemoRadiSam system radical SAM enzyme n=1 Tax=Corynebacterium sp. H78 TaxID=3133417 RepID=UPI0030A246AF
MSTDTAGHIAQWWDKVPEPADGTDKPARIQCDLCPRHCRLRDGQRGFCYVRKNVGGNLILDTYGRSSGFCLDPVEKKPLNHFLPGTSILSFGTAGCNLGCKFCQNYDISTSRQWDTLSQTGAPDAIAEAAHRNGAKSVAMTYNDPVIFAEYAIDTARACHERGIKTVAVTAGYITPVAREEFFDAFDAVNIDLKAFTPEFYKKLTGADLKVVLDNLEWLASRRDRREAPWIELTTLVIPGHNDAPEELAEMCRWVVETLGPDVPHHFSAFHPDHRMRDVPATPPETLRLAREIALEYGEQFPYTGNVHDADGDATICTSCGEVVIRRDWYELLEYRLDERGCCASCGTRIPGVFEEKPGTFGRRRVPVQVAR